MSASSSWNDESRILSASLKTSPSAADQNSAIASRPPTRWETRLGTKRPSQLENTRKVYLKRRASEHQDGKDDNGDSARLERACGVQRSETHQYADRILPLQGLPKEDGGNHDARADDCNSRRLQGSAPAAEATRDRSTANRQERRCRSRGRPRVPTARPGRDRIAVSGWASGKPRTTEVPASIPAVRNECRELARIARNPSVLSVYRHPACTARARRSRLGCVQRPLGAGERSGTSLLRRRKSTTRPLCALMAISNRTAATPSPIDEEPPTAIHAPNVPETAVAQDSLAIPASDGAAIVEAGADIDV